VRLRRTAEGSRARCRDRDHSNVWFCLPSLRRPCRLSCDVVGSRPASREVFRVGSGTRQCSLRDQMTNTVATALLVFTMLRSRSWPALARRGEHRSSVPARVRPALRGALVVTDRPLPPSTRRPRWPSLFKPSLPLPSRIASVFRSRGACHGVRDPIALSFERPLRPKRSYWSQFLDLLAGASCDRLGRRPLRRRARTSWSRKPRPSLERAPRRSASVACSTGRTAKRAPSRRSSAFATSPLSISFSSRRSSVMVVGVAGEVRVVELRVHLSKQVLAAL